MAAADLTLHEAAAALGVHYMTAYRYVRLGLLPAHKQGGTWRVADDDVRRFQVEAATGPREAAVGGPGAGRRRAPWAERLETRLLAGDARGAWSVIEAAMTAGAELDEVYLDIISPAMTSIGDRWERGDVDVSLEHRATGIALRLVGRLGPRFVRPGRTRGTVVLGTPAGERHALPVALLADLVRHDGWDVSDLGADVPDASFVHALTTLPDVVAVGLSVTTDGCVPSAVSAFAALRATGTEVMLVAGGRALHEHTAVSVGADAVASDARSFVALLRGLSGSASTLAGA